MKVRFVGHAGFAVECHSQTILCDPWLVGKVFNNSWALVSPANPPPFSAVDYIWISHEHPDHFSFPSLKSIPDSDRARIKILYQRHASPRVAEAILKMGFSQVIELPLYKWVQLTPKLEIYCGSVGSMDSFIAFRDRESKECILNTNDCVLNMDQIRYIKRCIGNVSVLFTQFSFAEWAGNDYDETHGAELKIGQFTQQIEVFKPEFTTPTASYVYFCNEENRRMNPWMNTPDTIAELNLKGINIMYPGDEWDSNVRIFNSDCAREKYRADYANIKIDHTPDPVDIAQISQAIERRLQETRSKLPKLLFNRVTPFTIHIHDLGKVVEVDVARGAHKIMVDDGKLSKSARYVMCSQVAWFTFAFSWGLSTLQSSGMYLDRQFEEGNRLYKLQNIVSTEVFRFAGIKGTLRTMHFWWRKKAEMIFRFTGTVKRQGEVSD